MHQVAHRVLRGSAAGNMEAVAHHADFIGNFDNFVQTVRHVDHADLFRAQFVEHFKEVVNIIGRQ